MKRIILVSSFICMILFNLQSQNFSRKTIPVFENTEVNAWGLSAIDYDDDGLLDIFATDVKGAERLFHNKGNGSFELIDTLTSKLNGGTRDCGLSWGDYDNDGLNDIYIGTQSGKNHFFKNNGDHTFSKISGMEISDDPQNSYDAVWADYNNDGWIDLFTFNVLTFDVTPREGAKNFIYQNMKDGTFQKITNTYFSKFSDNTISGSFADYDNDGDVDLFVPEMGKPNQFYINNGDGTFKQKKVGLVVSDSAVSICGSWADYDNDGDLDLYVANGVTRQNDFLFKNNGNGKFKKVLYDPIVENVSASWNGVWGDVDNDGDQDLYVSVWAGENLLFVNNGDGSFTQNLSDPIYTENKNTNSSVSVFGDFDLDGDLDFITADCISSRIRFYENTGNKNHWIQIKLIGTTSNKSAIGAQVRIKAQINGKQVSQMREISASNGFRNISNDFWAHFGLGDADLIDSLEIRWPSGKKSTLKNIEINQFLTITE